jgi:hypothetical protein
MFVALSVGIRWKSVAFMLRQKQKLGIKTRIPNREQQKPRGCHDQSPSFRAAKTIALATTLATARQSS